VQDLTRQGVEPNPGPPKPGARKNRRKPGTPRRTNPAQNLYQRKARTSRDALTQHVKDGISVTHREFFSDVTASTASTFANTITKTFMNPGLNAVYPYASQLAGVYQFYKIRNWAIEYEPVAALTVSGTVHLGAEYKVIEAAPASEQAFSSYDGYKTTPVLNATSWQPKKNIANRRYLMRQGLLPSNYEGYDPFAFLYAVTNCNAPAPTIVGKLYLRYTFEFITAQAADLTIAPSSTVAIIAPSVDKVYNPNFGAFIEQGAIIQNPLALTREPAFALNAGFQFPFGRYRFDLQLGHQTAAAAAAYMSVDLYAGIPNVLQSTIRHNMPQGGQIQVCFNSFIFASNNRAAPTPVFFQFTSAYAAALTLLAANTFIVVTVL
jgi:hypothetical protein